MTLDEALAAARAADRSIRIEWRDPVAAHGIEALEAVEPWIADPELGAFAVRVIVAIGLAGETDAAIGSLLSMQRLAPTEHIAGDIRWALERLRPTASVRPAGAPRPVSERAGWAWPGWQQQDFGRVAGTTWRRSRDAVGLVPWLLRALHKRDPAFASFPIYMSPEVHLADRDRYTQNGEWAQGWRASKLVVYAPGPTAEHPEFAARVVVGYYAEKGTGADKFGPVERTLWDWPRLLELLSSPPRRAALERTVAAHGMLVGDYLGQRFTLAGALVGFVGRVEDGELVLRDHGGSEMDRGWDALTERLAALPEGAWHDFHVWKEWPAETAIAAGPRFASESMVPVLLDLLPVYLDVIRGPGRG